MKHRDLDKQQRKRRPGWSRLRKQRGDSEPTQRYTNEEMEAMTEERGKGNGIMRLHTAELHLPKGLEEPTDGKSNNAAFRVLIVIITIVLLFIGIITYFVAQMPDKI